ncbi:MAG: DUF1573 domain-containing protein [Gemmataceae bacterium]|nr:DUF1573 domain-containing protein [Gemmataceae bacterium]
MPSQPAPSRTVVVLCGLIALVGCVLVAAAAKITADATRPRPVQQAKRESLVVDPARLDFGEVLENERFAWTLPIENRGDAEARITKFQENCVCAKFDPPSLVIPPGETREVRLTLDLTRKPEDRGEAARPFAVLVEPIVAEGGGAAGAGVGADRAGQAAPAG